MRRHILIVALTLAWLAVSPWLAGPAHAAEGTWKSLAPGVDYQRFGDEGQAFRLDLKQVELRVAEARNHASGKRRSDAQRAGRLRVGELATKTDAILAVNGGFFDPRDRPLGLLISGGRELNRLRKADWGVLSIRDGIAQLVHTRDYRRRPRKKVEFAIQSGPRLVVDKRILSLKDQWARRTAIGIRDGGKTLVIVVMNSRTLTGDLARILRQRFGCTFALNLDGGSSTQLWSPHKAVQSVSGLPVANAVLVVPRR